MRSKFYWFDPGVARAAAGLVYDPIDRLWKGVALESLIFHELRVYNLTSGKNRGIYFYRTGSGSEIDFIIETRKARPELNPVIICLEVKLAEKWDRRWERAMRSLNESCRVEVDKMFGIYMGKRTYCFEGITVLPVQKFLEKLHQGDVF